MHFINAKNDWKCCGFFPLNMHFEMFVLQQIQVKKSNMQIVLKKICINLMHVILTF